MGVHICPVLIPKVWWLYHSLLPWEPSCGCSHLADTTVPVRGMAHMSPKDSRNHSLQGEHDRGSHAGVGATSGLLPALPTSLKVTQGTPKAGDIPTA